MKSFSVSRSQLLYWSLSLGVFLLLSFIFFFKLGDAALQSYDEAWYAEISRNLTQQQNPLKLTFNGQAFTDHPPFGFWLMAISTLLFGSNEWTVRSISALLGGAAVIVVALIGRELRDWKTGWGASLILLSSLWFMLRARSGNLDIPFLFWEVTSLFMITKLAVSRHYWYGLALSLTALFLTKTVVGFGILPLVLLALWHHRKLLTVSLVAQMASIMALLISPWYVYNAARDATFLHHHFFEIGGRAQENSFSVPALIQNLFYVQVGIGKWYKIALGSLVVSVGLFIKSKSARYPLGLLATGLLGFGAPFLLSTQTEVWHLIPLYPLLALIISYNVQSLLGLLLPKLSLLGWVGLVSITLLAVYQFSQLANLLYGQTPISSEKAISIAAGQYQSPIYLMDTFYPATVYYSQQPVIPLHWDPNALQVMSNLLIENASGTAQPKLFIINESLKNQLNNSLTPFTILVQSGNYLLIQ